MNILKYLNPSKESGIDNLNGKFLKDGADILAGRTSQFSKLSTKLSAFPRICKIAKVKLFFKKGSKTDPQNYCPVSLLSILSKIIERTIHDQTKEFLSKKTIFLADFNLGFEKTIPQTHVSDI